MSISFKKTILALLLLTFVVGVVFTPKVLAQNSTSENVVLEKGQIIDHDYFAAGGNVTLHGTVNGDAYVFGGTINLDSVINGDLIVAGGTVTVGGEVKNDLRAAGGNVNIDGKIGGNILVGSGTLNLSKSSSVGGSVIAGSGTVDISTPLSKTTWIGSGQTRINSNLKSDANISAEQVVLDSDAKIDGNLTYFSDNQIRILQGATVSGVVKREVPVNNQQEARKFLGIALGFGFMVKLSFSLSLLVLGLLLIKLFPQKTLQISQEVSNSPLGSFGWGLATTLISLFLIFVLLVSVIGIPLAILTFTALGLGLYMSGIFVGLWLGRVLFSNLDKNKNYYWAFITGFVVLEILTILPVIGGIIKFIYIFVGLGALLRVKKATYQELKSKL